MARNHRNLRVLCREGAQTRVNTIVLSHCEASKSRKTPFRQNLSRFLVLFRPFFLKPRHCSEPTAPTRSAHCPPLPVQLTSATTKAFTGPSVSWAWVRRRSKASTCKNGSFPSSSAPRRTLRRYWGRAVGPSGVSTELVKVVCLLKLVLASHWQAALLFCLEGVSFVFSFYFACFAVSCALFGNASQQLFSGSLHASPRDLVSDEGGGLSGGHGSKAVQSL